MKNCDTFLMTDCAMENMGMKMMDRVIDKVHIEELLLTN